MAIFRKLIQGVQNTAAQAHIFLMVKPHLFRDGICRLKSDTPDIVCQAVRVFLHHLDAVIPIGLIDLGCMAGRNIMTLQKEHDILDLLLLLPALLDPLYADFADPGHFQKTIRILLDHVQRIGSELFYDPSGKLRSDPFYKAASKVFFNAKYRSRQRLLERFHGELPAILRINPPIAAEIQNTSHVHIRHGADYRHQILITLCPALDDRVSIFRILVRDALNHTPQVFHDTLSPPSGQNRFS